MAKTILITGATGGIGFETAKMLTSEGHTLLLHGRSDESLSNLVDELSNVHGAGLLHTYPADLSNFEQIRQLASSIVDQHGSLDVLINNAGVFKMKNPTTDDGYDMRFVINTVAPYLLTELLLPAMSASGRVINLSSAAQESVDLAALNGSQTLSDSQAYAQSKLALTMWTFHLAKTAGADAPAFIAVNPASFLGSKMVKEAYGTDGNDLSIGADILTRAATSGEFESASGRYYDNDRKAFSQPHADALDESKNRVLVEAVESLIGQLG